MTRNQGFKPKAEWEKLIAEGNIALRITFRNKKGHDGKIYSEVVADIGGDDFSVTRVIGYVSDSSGYAQSNRAKEMAAQAEQVKT